MSIDPKEIALEYLERVRALDTAGMLGFFAEGAKVWLPGQGWMEPSGLAALLDGARALLVKGICFDHQDAFVAGNRAVVMTRCDSPLIKGGSYVNDFCFVFTISDDGKITEMREFTDSGPAIAAFHS